MPIDPASREDLDRLGELITSWAEGEKAANEWVLAVDQIASERRWFVRLRGEEKQVTTIWFWLRERTLHYETQFMPMPEENHVELYDMLLRLNVKLFGMRFAIGDEDAIYLVGQLPWSAVDEAELDRIVGSAYQYTEQWFRPAMRIGYQSKFRG